MVYNYNPINTSKSRKISIKSSSKKYKNISSKPSSKSIKVPKKFKDAKQKYTKFQQNIVNKEQIKKKLEKDKFMFIDEFKDKYNNASNVNNNNINNFYINHGINRNINNNSLRKLTHIPSIVKEKGVKEALKIKKVNIREGEKIVNELKLLNKDYFSYIDEYKTKYKYRIKLNKIIIKIYDYFSKIKKKILKYLTKIKGFITKLFDESFKLLQTILFKIGGAVLTFFKAPFGAVVWIYNKSGELQSFILNCITDNQTKLEYTEDEVNLQCEDYLDSISDTLIVVKKSLSNKNNDMIIMEDINLCAYDLEAEQQNIQMGGGIVGHILDNVIQFIFNKGKWVINNVTKLLLSILGFTIKWTFKASIFVLKNTAFNLMKEGVFLIVPRTNAAMSYIIKYCDITYDFLMQNDNYVYRLSKKINEERNKRLINGRKIKFYHKTLSEAAGSIINYQTFFRSEKGGYFGPGIYFCSNPNSTHNKSNASVEQQTILESEVLIGKIFKVDHKKPVDYTFGDLLAKKCDTIRAISLRDDEYIIFSQDQVCSIKDYLDPIGYWGYLSGKQQNLVIGHTQKPLSQIIHHPYWFPFKSFGSKGSGNKNSMVVNFNGPKTQIIKHIKWNGTDDDLWEIYSSIKTDKSIKLKSKNVESLSSVLLKKGYANPSQILNHKLFIKLIHHNLSEVCLENKNVPEYLNDNIY